MIVLAAPAAAAAVYLLIYLALPLLPLDTQVRAYIFQPLLWGLVILLAVRFLPGYRPLGKPRLRSTFILLAAMTAFLQIVLYVIGGLFSGFGRNPANLTPTGIIINLAMSGFMLIALELCRAALVTHYAKRRPFLIITLASLLFTAISIPLSQFTGFRPGMHSVSMALSTWLPLLAENFLASMLVMVAGARASLAYRGLLAAFWWFMPVLPDLNWVFKGLFGAAVPVMGMMLVNSYHLQELRRGKGGKRTRATMPGGWIATSLICVVIVWFAVGIFPFQPQLVGSGSMSPTMNTGDVAIVAKGPASRIREGDVIQFSTRDRVTVLHRVIERSEGGFVTKGDANNAADPEVVRPEFVVGKVVFSVPKIGMVSILLKSIFTKGE